MFEIIELFSYHIEYLEMQKNCKDSVFEDQIQQLLCSKSILYRSFFTTSIYYKLIIFANDFGTEKLRRTYLVNIYLYMKAQFTIWKAVTQSSLLKPIEIRLALMWRLFSKAKYCIHTFVLFYISIRLSKETLLFLIKMQIVHLLDVFMMHLPQAHTGHAAHYANHATQTICPSVCNSNIVLE